MMYKLYIPDIRAAAKKRAAGYLDEVLAAGQSEDNLVLHIDYNVYLVLQKKYTSNSKPNSDITSTYSVSTVQEGAGTELKKLLSKLSLKPVANCKCNQRISEMNQKGVEWCKQNIGTIVGWLKEEATRAKLPFIEVGARILVKRAIRNAKRGVGD